ncbi:MAG TPA: pilus assembly PilX N-terminal domain-containing protein, partial [Duganella sp.]|nr:pilus assembly PilX N-terminal domain-containing protein [Duganella sp.]
MKLRMIRKSRGVALVTAIFLLVVLSGLAVAVVSLTTSQQASATQDEQGARAYQAARAGIEWALFISLQTGGGLANNPLGCSGAAWTFGLPAESLSAFTVTVTCGQPVDGYGNMTPGQPDLTAGGVTITSTACNQPGPNGCPNLTPGPDYVQRVI